LSQPTAQQLQADPTAPLPPAGGFVNVPLATFPQSPLLQTGMSTVPQTTTPQAAVTSTFLDQLQMTTPTSSQLSSPLTTGALVFETSARTTLPGPHVSSPLPSFTTPRAEGLGQEDYYLRAITEQIFSDRLRPRGSRSRGHSGSDFRHRDDYSSTSSTSSGSGFLLSDLVPPQRRRR
jgi:hypothetical protein